MTNDEAYSSWLYFCSLVSKFENTMHFVDHSLDDDGNLLNKSVFSNEFYTILFLASSEFETIAKCICIESGITLPDKANIVTLSRKLLQKYPNIGQTEIKTLYQSFFPLKDWSVINNKVVGLNWWNAYAKLKHNRYNCFKEATIENCLYSLGSLMVLELYLQKIICGNTNKTRDNMFDYFSHKYAYDFFVTEGGTRLPDF